MTPAEGAVLQMPRQLSLDVGGATVDTSVITSLSFSAEVNNIGRDLAKGADVKFTATARVTGVKVQDRYDPHGNVVETIRKHVLRIDDFEVAGIDAEAYKAAPQGDPDDPDDNEPV